MDANLKALSCDTGYGTETFALLWGAQRQVLTIHALVVSTSNTVQIGPAEPAHPVACSTDADCLPGTTSPTYTCQAGICQNASAGSRLMTDDVIALCQAAIPWPKVCPYLTEPSFAKRMDEIGLVCGSSTYCSTVPADCRQPTVVAPGLDAGITPNTTPMDGGAGALDTI
jgi:hypothetical protein